MGCCTRPRCSVSSSTGSDLADFSSQDVFDKHVSFPPFSHDKDSHDSLPDLRPSDKVIDPIRLVMQFCKQFWSSHTALTAFAKASVAEPTSRDVQEGHRNSLWPVPIPRFRWTAYKRLGPRRRMRRRFLETRHQLLVVALCALNFQALGFCKRPPPQACLGAQISPSQHRILERLEDMISHFLRMSPFESGDLGRSREQFETLIGIVEKLPTCQSSDFDLLSEMLGFVHDSLDPYGSHFNREKMPPEAAEKFHECQLNPSSIPSKGLAVGSKPVAADRVKWENPPSFDATPYLDGLVRSAFEDPEVLRLPPHHWPSSKPARVHCSRQELLKLVERWDRLGACCVIDSSTKDLDEAVGLFCVPKDDLHDRLIINPKTINGRMFSVSHATKDLAPGSMLSLLSLEPGFAYRFNADDLTDFYYTFCVSHRRASRNALRMEFSWDELKHLSCVDSSFQGQKLLVCLKTLAMGDSLAVEIAQQSHSQVLQKLCGAMLPSETLRYRHAVPRSDFIELLAIDDHVGIQKVSLKELRDSTPKRDSQIFAASEVAYKRVGLVQHPKKRKRGQTEGIILGADFDGLKGKVMAPRNRVLILCLVSAALAKCGTCTKKVLSVLLGCWIHVLLFRRVLFSIMDDLFRQGDNLAPDDVFCLSRKSRCELQLLSVLGPLAQSDLTATYSDTLFCTDASPEAGAVISAPIGATATKELWRHCEQRGYYTRLQSPLSEIMHEKGLDPISTAHYEPRTSDPISSSYSIPPPLQEGVLFDCVEIFRGTGNWSEAHLKQGLIVHAGIDISGSRLRYADMGEPSTFHELVGLSLRRVVREWHCGLPCISFGTLRRPRCDQKSFPGVLIHPIHSLDIMFWPVERHFYSRFVFCKASTSVSSSRGVLAFICCIATKFW